MTTRNANERKARIELVNAQCEFEHAKTELTEYRKQYPKDEDERKDQLVRQFLAARETYERLLLSSSTDDPELRQARREVKAQRAKRRAATEKQQRKTLAELADEKTRTARFLAKTKHAGTVVETLRAQARYARQAWEKAVLEYDLPESRQDKEKIIAKRQAAEETKRQHIEELKGEMPCYSWHGVIERMHPFPNRVPWGPYCEYCRARQECKEATHQADHVHATMPTLIEAKLWARSRKPSVQASDETLLRLFDESRDQKERKERAEEKRQERQQRGFPTLAVGSIPIKPLVWLVQNLIPLNSCGFAHGQDGSSKSWLAGETALAVATGTPMLGRFAARKGRVLMLNEGGFAAVNRRLHALAAARGVNLQDLDIRVIDRSSIDLTTEEHIEALMDTVAGWRPDLLVLDPLRMLHSGDEDSSTEMIKVLQVLRDIQEQHHCCVLLIHHDTKRAEDRQHESARARGSSALAGWRDYRASVRQTKDGVVWVNPYAREAPPLPSFAFRLVEKDGGKQISLRLTAVKEPGAKPDKEESPTEEAKVSGRATARLTKLVEGNPKIPVATLARKLGKRNEYVLSTLKAAGWTRSRGPHGSWKRSLV